MFTRHPATVQVERHAEVSRLDSILATLAKAIARAPNPVARDVTLTRVDDVLDRRLQLQPPVDPVVIPPMGWVANQRFGWGR